MEQRHGCEEDGPVRGAWPDVSDDFTGAGARATAKPLAVIIEPRGDLAAALGDVLGAAGFEVAIAATHGGAALLSEGRCPLLLLACVPSPGETLREAYIAACRHGCGEVATVVMLSDRCATYVGAPPCAIPLVKPFSKDDLLEAIDCAQLAAHLTVTPLPAWMPSRNAFLASPTEIRCAHEGCFCARPTGGRYCSEFCQGASQAAADAVDDGLTCGCRHGHCGARRVDHA
ncbi:hypothetical protein ACVWWJ_002377 [Luteibacter sp. HA06]